MSDAEVAAAMDEVRVRGKRGTAHARSAASVKQALRHGIDVIYHASFTDEETLDMLEAAKDRVFVAPGIAIIYAMLHEAERTASHTPKAVAMGYQIEWDAALDSLKAMHKRGVRVLPGRRLRLRLHAALPERARPGVLRALPGLHAGRGDPLATVYGGQIMMKGHELGQVKEGYLADLLLVDGDPLANIAILRDPKRILAVMKDGKFAKRPEIAQSRQFRRAA
jgi:imidazolonepropionase-like amidohydrolase